MNLRGFLYGDISTGAAINAAEAVGEAHKALTAAESLDARLDRMLLAFEALWTLVRDKLPVSDEELAGRMNDLD